MKWVTGHVRCQVTGKKPTRNDAASPVPRLAERPNSPRLSQPCSKLIAANQTNMPGITIRRKDIVTSLTCGMFLSLGNIREARLLNFDRPTRLRLNATAEVHEQDPLLALYHRGKSHRVPLFTSAVSGFSALTCHEPRIRFRLKPP